MVTTIYSLFLWRLWNSSMAEITQELLLKTTHLGVYDTEIEAAKAYDDAVRDLHGEYAVLNLEKDYG